MSTALDDALHGRVDFRKEWAYLCGVFAGSGVGYLGTAGAPIIVAALIESGLGTQQAGDLGTIELTMIGASSLRTRRRYRRMPSGWRSNLPTSYAVPRRQYGVSRS